ncbi:MAG: primosomal protein N' [Ignavibacteria bacterium]|nr:primosomal protein N' [Ignavibacteria bacterium]
MPLYADIAIPNVPRDALSYEVPEGLAADIAPGQRVVVTLGKRPVMGFVVAVHRNKPGFAVKMVLELLDPKPILSASLLKLCAWVGAYYFCPMGDALKAAIPQGMDLGSERFVSLVTDDRDAIQRAIGTSKTKRHIIDLLLTGEVLSEEAVKKAIGLKSVSSQLRDLMMEGVVAVESVLERQQARAKTISVVRLLPPWNGGEKIRELMEIMERRAPKQVNILAVLWSAHTHGKPTLPMAALLAEAKATNAQVSALVEKGIVEILQEEVTREVQLRYEERIKMFALSEQQKSVLSEINAQLETGGFKPYLLYGVTASGKTQVYIEAIRRVLALGRRALVLVPEIALTPQLVFRFRSAFGKDVAVMHSRMSVGERYDAWRKTLDGDYRIVIGVRSAVFAPLENVGLVIVDEEHESSYKQVDPQPRYHARDAAVMRAHIDGATVLLGSATPSAESWHNAQLGKYTMLRMPSRVDDAALPAIVTVNTVDARKNDELRGSLAEPVLAGIRDRMAKGEASILLHNRRGYAPHLECRDCGHVEQCGRCSVSLVYHKDRHRLRCHYCGWDDRPPVVCPRCGGQDLEMMGAGTQRVEEDLLEQIPHARVLRMDLDTTRKKGSHDLMLTSFGEGEADVLLGTQMVAKGLDFERVTLVGVVAAEQSLLLPDFRAGERTFQMLTQVSGRAGRGNLPGEVLIQAARPDHPVLQQVIAHDYEGFIANELTMRKHLLYPPFTRLVLLTFSGTREEQVATVAEAFHRAMVERPALYRALPPQPAMVKKINNRFRYHLLVKVIKGHDPDGHRFAQTYRDAVTRAQTAAKTKAVRIDVDVDPQTVM